jgi:hypothetical protein
VTTAPVALPRPWPAAGFVRRVLEEDALPIGAVAACTALLAVALPGLLVQDSWLALVDGRLIAAHGVPHIDTLTYWTLGRPWVDQQWGAHLVLYWLAEHLGLRAVALFGVGCVAAALGAAAVAARRLGASPRSTAICVLLPLVCAPWLAQVRTQSLALLPFVLVFGLIAWDSRRPGERVYLVLPLLVLWSNLHGSVALAAAFVGLYGLAKRRLLLAAAPACLLVSPYGFDLVGYYRLMLVDPPLASFVREWRPPGFDGVTVAFFVSALVLTVLWIRHRGVLTPFERWALPLLLLAALAAVRNIIWFELAATVAFPRLLDAAWPARALPRAVRRVNLVAGSAAVIAVLALLAVHRPALDPERAGAAAIATAAGANGIVLADDAHADWLLWEEPALIGRVAYDVRFELFSKPELIQLGKLQEGSRPAWRTCGAVARVVTFPAAADRRKMARQGVLGPNARALVELPGLAAVTRAASAGRCNL